MDTIDCETLSPEFCHLVFHKRDQRTDHERCPAARNPRQLITQRFPGSSGHHEQDVFPVNRRAADCFLSRTKGGESECAVEQLLQTGIGYGQSSIRLARQDGRRIQSITRVLCHALMWMRGTFSLKSVVRS
jgi:hypothetical protein